MKTHLFLLSHCYVYVLKCYHVCVQTRWVETPTVRYQRANVPVYYSQTSQSIRGHFS